MAHSRARVTASRRPGVAPRAATRGHGRPRNHVEGHASHAGLAAPGAKSDRKRENATCGWTVCAPVSGGEDTAVPPGPGARPGAQGGRRGHPPGGRLGGGAASGGLTGMVMPYSVSTASSGRSSGPPPPAPRASPPHAEPTNTEAPAASGEPAHPRGLPAASPSVLNVHRRFRRRHSLQSPDHRPCAGRAVGTWTCPSAPSRDPLGTLLWGHVAGARTQAT